MEERPMKPNLLRTPIVNSALLLVVCSLLVYFTLTSPDASIWSSIGAIFVLIFRTVQWAFGLALGLLVCLAVLVGIFLVSVALVDGSSASRMYEGLRKTIAGWLEPVTGLLRSDQGAEVQSHLDSLELELKNDSAQRVEVVRQKLATVQQEFASTVQGLQGKIRSLEEALIEKAPSQKVDELLAEVSTLGEGMSAGEGSMKTLQGAVEQLGQKVTAVSPEAILADLPTRVGALEQQEPVPAVDLQPCEEKIALLQSEVEALKSALSKNSAADKENVAAAVAAEGTGAVETAGHRLLSYFEKDEDQQKLAALVTETLKKDMTYAQVTDYLIQEMDADGGTIIREHPSLAKDYIRQCRRKA